jgi:hypothetical protein
MKHFKEYSDYLLDLQLSPLEQSEINNWISQNEKSFQFSDDAQLSQSMTSIIQNLMQDLGISADKKSAVESYVSDRMQIQDDESVPVLTMSPYASFQYANFVDGLSRYELN